MNIEKNQNNNIMTDVNKDINKRKLSKLNDIISSFSLGLMCNKPVVAILRLEGVIGKNGSMKSSLNLNYLNSLIEKTFAISKLDAVCLCINSPGGSPVQAELITNRIIDLAKEKNIPVYSFVEDVAASGGYWLANAGKYIYVSKSSIVGSIVGTTGTLLRHIRNKNDNIRNNEYNR